MNWTSLELALELANRDLSVFPVPRPRPGTSAGEPGDGKVPAIAWRTYQSRRPTEAELAAWFNGEPQNVAVVTGTVSGIVVVDSDSPEALRWATRHLPYTPWQVRTAKGYHLYYRHPDEPVRNRARVDPGSGRLAVDVRGDGGFVIGPGSVHASGHVYVTAGDWREPRATLPVFDTVWLDARPTPTTSARPALPATGDTVTRARRYLAAIPPPEIGHGSDTATLYAACRLIRGFAVPEAEAVALLDEWAGGRPGWDRDWLARKVRHAVRYGTEAVGGLL